MVGTPDLNPGPLAPTSKRATRLRHVPTPHWYHGLLKIVKISFSSRRMRFNAAAPDESALPAFLVVVTFCSPGDSLAAFWSWVRAPAIRKALVREQTLNFQNRFDVLPPVAAVSRTAFGRTNRRKLLLPKPQYVGFHPGNLLRPPGSGSRACRGFRVRKILVHADRSAQRNCKKCHLSNLAAFRAIERRRGHPWDRMDTMDTMRNIHSTHRLDFGQMPIVLSSKWFLKGVNAYRAICDGFSASRGHAPCRSRNSRSFSPVRLRSGLRIGRQELG